MIRTNRLFWALLAMVPAAVLTDRPAAASPEDEIAAVAPLPLGVHQGRDGRYYKDFCPAETWTHYRCLAKRLLPDTWRPGQPIPQPEASGSAPAGEMAPADVIAGYSLTNVAAGSGVVAIEDMPDSTALSDLNAYRTAYGLPALAQCSGNPTSSGTPCFAVADENGNLNPTGLTDGGDSDGETSLDMDMISAACPNCSILLMEFTASGGPSDSDFTAASAAAANLGAVAASISWGGSESGDSDTGYTIPGKLLVLAASGDQGYEGELSSGGALLPYKHHGGSSSGGGSSGGGTGLTPNFPASARTVLAVGGTILSAGPSYTETVWNDSSGATGSGCSTEFPMPTYQSNYGTSKFGTCTMRATNDISAAADFGSGGIAEYNQGAWAAVVGTSAATPLVAAILTRLNLAVTVSNDFGFIYTHPTAFNDITSGTNDPDSDCTNAVMCNAGAGWDGPSGIGTPNGAELAALAGGGSSSGSGSSSGTSSGSSSGASSSGGDDGGAGSSSGTSSGTGSSGTSSGTGSSGTSSGTGSSGTSSGTSSGGGGGIYGGEDAGTVLDEDGGTGTSSGGGTSSGSNGSSGGNGFGGSSGGSGSSGCSTSGAPSEDAGVMGLLVGAMALVGARRRNSKK